MRSLISPSLTPTDLTWMTTFDQYLTVVISWSMWARIIETSWYSVAQPKRVASADDCSGQRLKQ